MQIKHVVEYLTNLYILVSVGINLSVRWCINRNICYYYSLKFLPAADSIWGNITLLPALYSDSSDAAFSDKGEWWYFIVYLNFQR